MQCFSKLKADSVFYIKSRNDVRLCIEYKQKVIWSSLTRSNENVMVFNGLKTSYCKPYHIDAKAFSDFVFLIRPLVESIQASLAWLHALLPYTIFEYGKFTL